MHGEMFTFKIYIHEKTKQSAIFTESKIAIFSKIQVLRN